MKNFFNTTPEEIRKEIQEIRFEIKNLRFKIEKAGLWAKADDLEALENAKENLAFLRELLESL